MPRGKLLDGCLGLRVPQDMNEFLGRMADGIGRREGQHLALVGEEFSRAGDLGAFRVRDVELITLVVFKSRAKVPGLFAMWRPALPGVGIFKDEGGEWRAIKIKLAKHLGMGR
jgi:hypothetical protein